MNYEDGYLFLVLSTIFKIFHYLWQQEKSSPLPSAAVAIHKLKKHKHLTIQRVTATTATAVHRELSRNHGTEFRRLVQGRLTPLFVYDFFCCVAGHHLLGSSLIRGRVPTTDEYLPGGNFWWSGIQIHVVRNARIKAGRCGSIQGLYVFHDAYLSSYPGPTPYYHDVDPVLCKTKVRIVSNHKKKNVVHVSKNVGIDFKDKYAGSGLGRGSKMWCDVPVLAGPGIGRFVLAHCLETRTTMTKNKRQEAEEGAEESETEEREEGEEGGEEEEGGKEDEEKDKARVNFFVSVAGGKGNNRMLSLLLRFGFDRLYMTHPITGDSWLDEAGDELFVMSREGPIDYDSATQLLTITKTANHKKKATTLPKIAHPKTKRQRSKSRSRAR